MQSEFDFTAAENGKNTGMLMAEDNANRKINGWSDLAMSYLRGFLSMRGPSPFLAEEVRQYAKAQGLEDAPSDRAWGGIMNRAARLSFIRKIGYGLTTNPAAHRTPATLWCKA